MTTRLVRYPRFKSAALGPVTALGNFDGVHLGHQQLLAAVRNMAAKQGAPSMATFFEPQPAEYFSPAQAPPRLTDFRAKVLLLGDQGLDYLHPVAFNADLQALAPAEFVKKILIDRLNISGLVVGYDFKFGKDRAGDADFLVQQALQWGFAIEVVEAVDYQARRASSTWIREALSQGDFAQAKALLTRPYRLSGKVVAGDAIGRKMGFPTANLALKHPPALQGVFAVRARLESLAGRERVIDGVANIGMRPTLGGQSQRFEVHLFDFDQDIYGERLSVEFVAKIRGETKFSNLQVLQTAIHEDCLQARAVLAE